MKNWIIGIVLAGAGLQAVTLERGVLDALQRQMPLACSGIAVEADEKTVLLKGEVLCVADKHKAERIAKGLTQGPVVNRIVIGDPHLRDGF